MPESPGRRSRIAIAVATAIGNTDSVLLSEAELAHMAIDQGHWALAQRHRQAAIDAIEAGRMDAYSTTALACAVLARVALHFGEAAAAERYVVDGMRARVQCTSLLPKSFCPRPVAAGDGLRQP